MEKRNIIDRLNMIDYSQMLEEVLTNKSFPEETKNILLNIIYKIESSYKDYKTTKVNVPLKKEMLEEVIYLIEKCNKIEIIKPKTENEDLNKVYIDSDKLEITAYPNEVKILYCLCLLESDIFLIPDTYELFKPSINKVLTEGRAYNFSECIRDFDGWAWNLNKTPIENIFLNFIYQSMNLLMNMEDILDEKDIIIAIKEGLMDVCNSKSANDIIELFLKLSIICNILEDNKEKKRLNDKKAELEQEYEIILDKKAYLEETTEKKKRIEKELAKIESILNDDVFLKKEYINTNKELPQEKRIFSLSDFSELQENEKEKLIKELEENNNKLNPNNYLKEKERTSIKNKSIK